MNDLLQLAVTGHGGAQRLEQVSRFRAAASISGAIWALKGKPGLLDDVALECETRDQRLKMNPFPQPGWKGTYPGSSQLTAVQPG